MTFLIIGASIIVWIGCGILTYGIVVADSHEIWSDYTKHYGDEEWLNSAFPRAHREGLFWAAFGPLGTTAAWLTRWQYRHTRPSKGLRFRA